MQKIKIPVVLGTARDSRYSDKAANFILNEINKRSDMEGVMVDVKDHLFGRTVVSWDDKFGKTASWKKIMSESGGLILVIPEYNHGYPGELKILLDSLNEEYHNKPVLLFGVSVGSFGGTRVVDHIKPVLVELGLIPVSVAGYFINIQSAFNDDGSIKDKEQINRISKNFDALADLAKRFSK